MRIFKSHPLLKLFNSYLVDSAQPSNISYAWNFGSLLAFCLGIQIVTGVTLAMHYNSSVLEAFNSVEHIMRDVNNGWLIRYLHSNTASAFFFLVYLHIGRGLYYGSYKAPRTLVWTIGSIIFILMMATAFLGYKYSPTWHKFYFINDLYETTYKLSILTCKLNVRYSSTNNSFNSETLNKFLLNENLEPIYCYEDLHLDFNKDKVKQELRDLSGVYLILNKTTLDYYIGSAASNRFYSRFYNHLISLTGSKIVKLAVRKYKLCNFAFIILELFPDVVNKENNKKLLDREDFYLKYLLPNYIILTEAGSSFGYKHTELDRLKMKTNYSDERRELIGNLNKGKHLSEDTLEKIREAALIRKPRSFSKEALANKQKNSKAVIIHNLNRTVYGEYSSIMEMTKHINCNEKTIRRALKSDSKRLKRRWIVNYK